MFGSKIVPFLVLLLFLWLGADFHEQYMVKLIITRIHFFFPFNFPCLNPGASCKFFNFPVNLVSNFQKMQSLSRIRTVPHKRNGTPRNPTSHMRGTRFTTPSSLRCILLPAARCSVL